jgi:hypothetical protein
VKIPITDILLHLRQRVMEGDSVAGQVAPTAIRVASRAGAVALGRPRLPPPLNRWTMVQPLPAMAPDFRRWWRRRARE